MLSPSTSSLRDTSNAKCARPVPFLFFFFLFSIRRHAVRRYIFENQGLVRRMYGDQRHSLIVVSELEARRLRYDDEPNRAFRTDGGRNPHRVRPNSRYAARLKTPPAASHETEDSAETTTVPITPTEATPTTVRVPVRTPGLVGRQAKKK